MRSRSERLTLSPPADSQKLSPLIYPHLSLSLTEDTDRLKESNMRSNALAAAAALAGSAGLASFAAAGSVEAGTLTTVLVDAPLYDTNLSAANGCDPVGCVGDLTRVSWRLYWPSAYCSSGVWQYPPWGPSRFRTGFIH